MNVLYLHAHDAGRFVSPYRQEMLTPHLAAFAGTGTVFTNAHCAAPTCSPSRAALLTGQSPHESGMLGLAHRGFSLRHPERHLAAFLKRTGYESALSGIQHVFHGGELDAYDHVFRAERKPEYTEYDRRIAEQAVNYLREERTQPFFLDCGFWLPHRPFPSPSEKWNPATIALPDFLSDTPEVRADWAAFITAVESMDACCGIVLDALREAKLEESTLVIFTVDHGIAFPGMKCNLNGRGTGVSLIVRSPGDGAVAGNRCDALVSHLDLYPTICDVCALDAPDWLQGTSLRPLLEGTAEEVRSEVFGEVTYHAAYESMRSVRTREHNLILVFDDDLSPVPANIDDSPEKDIWLREGFLERKRPVAQLFDLAADPEETRNVAADPKYAEIRGGLEKRLHQWMEKTGDPLLLGAVPLPEGAWCNPREQVSAD